MKKLLLSIGVVVVLNSCEWFTIQDTANYWGFHGYVYELKEVLGKDGKPVTEYPVSDFPPFIYERCLSVRPELQLREIDTLYYLSDGDGTILKKFAIVSKNINKSKFELFIELENQQFIWTRNFMDASILVSQQTATKSSARKTEYMGRYISYSTNPKNWKPVL